MHISLDFGSRVIVNLNLRRNKAEKYMLLENGFSFSKMGIIGIKKLNILIFWIIFGQEYFFMAIIQPLI